MMFQTSSIATRTWLLGFGASSMDSGGIRNAVWVLRTGRELLSIVVIAALRLVAWILPFGFRRTLDAHAQPRGAYRLKGLPATMEIQAAATAEIPLNSMVFVIDDDDSVRRSIMRLLRSAAIPCEAFSSANAYLEKSAHQGPSCLVLDVRMPGLDGLELQQRLARKDAQIVFITGHGDVPMCADAMKAGAVDFLTKPFDENLLLGAVSRALHRSIGIRNSQSERTEARARLEKLTPREFEVMKYVIAGFLNKQIAAELGSAEKTIKIHRGQVMRKMEVSSVADLVRIAQAAGVVPASSH